MRLAERLAAHWRAKVSASPAAAEERHLGVYTDRAVVAHYARATALQPAERAILEELDERLPRSSMLDVGVGGGRTLLHFAPRAQTYVGVDYSLPMLRAARSRPEAKDCALVHADARALPFADASFDVVLFSHNGIDYVGHDDRIRILSEIRRVLRATGAFAFSTHNLARDDLEFEAPPNEPWLTRARSAARRWRLRATNPGHEGYAQREHAVVNDGAFRFRVCTYHIRAAAQVEQLVRAGFTKVRIFSGRSGVEVTGGVLPRDPWLYFLASVA